jgi:hypothetical protein
MRRAARSLSTVGRNDHWQLAKNPIPTYKSIRAIRALQNLLQNWRRKPHGLPVFKGHSKQLNLDQIITAQVCNPHGRVDEHFTSSRRAGRLRIVVLGNATRAAKRENSRVVAAAHVVHALGGLVSCWYLCTHRMCRKYYRLLLAAATTDYARSRLCSEPAAPTSAKYAGGILLRPNRRKCLLFQDHDC